MKRRLMGFVVSLLLCIQLITPFEVVKAAQVLYDNATGNQDGYDYELWKDYGTTSMTLNGGGAFSCSWNNIGNALFRKGIKFDSTKSYEQVGNISIDYGCDYRPSGNSYLCVYGWSKNPLVEYYIVESWGSWRPPGASSKGTINVDGGTYDVYETTRVNQPSIEGNTTFKQFWSVRTSKKTSGTISVTDHFRAWSRMGMKLGNLYEVALNVEGYQSSGSANVYKNTITVGGSGSSTNPNPGTNDNTVSTGNKIECEDMSISGKYAGKIDSPFSGVALYANDDACTFTQNFKNATNDFTLRGCSNNSNMARVDLYIGGDFKGTFYYGDANPAEYTIKNVSHGTGNQQVKLVVTADDGNWDAYVDNLQISGEGSQSDGNAGGNTGTIPSGKMVALTFDDGPSGTTSEVLDVLQRYNAVATFFLIGQNVNGNMKATMQRQLNMGCELACHSYTHSDMGNMGAWQVQNEISQCVNAIKGQVNTDIKFFRAPYLSTSNTMFQNINLTFIQGISCNDWESYVSAEQRKNTILNNVSDGSIVLLHDFQGNSNTVQALPGIIEGLRNQGYTFVTVSDLFKYKGVNPNVGYKVWSNVYQ